MLRRLYHGSRDISKKPVYGYGKKYNDYGLGFYCTEDINMAKEWQQQPTGTATPTAMSWTAEI